MTFNDLEINKDIINNLTKLKITEPTEIQEKTFTLIKDGKDVIACSQTGSGKTIAYLLPIISNIDITSKNVQAIILVPTQELAMQIHHLIASLCANTEHFVSDVVLIGNTNVNRQIEQIKANKPQIVIGTTSRIIQLNNIKKLPLHCVKTLVIDEADKMLDKANIDNIRTLRSKLLKFTQVVLFSASMDKKSISIAESITKSPEVINISDKITIPSTIKHMFIIAERNERIEIMRKIAKAINPSKAIVFINTKYDLEESTQKLKYHNYNAECINGDIDKNARKNIINKFKDGSLQYLISTDLSARGLQIDNIDAVINVNLPEDSMEYLHRAGRCGRNNNTGVCISIITKNELDKIKSLQKKFGINIYQKRLYQGKLVSK